jgi:hypothetical protein
MSEWKNEGVRMPAKEVRPENPVNSGEMLVPLKQISRFLRLLTWQMFFLLALLSYFALRPQAGRYQFTVAGDDVGVFDTSNSRAWMIKLDKKIQKDGKIDGIGQPAPSAEEKAQ